MANYIHDLRQLVGHRPVILTFAGGILVNAAQQVLLQKRAGSDAWGLPGGALELGVFLVGGWVNATISGSGNVIARYAGKPITQNAFYHQLQTSPASKTVLANILIYDAMDHAYGKQVKAATVNAAYTAAKQQYGSQFTTYLNANNLTPQTLKQTLRLNTLSAAALHAQVKPTTAQLQNLYQSYQPKVKVAHILTTSASTAQTVVNALKRGKSFSSLAQEYSIDTASSIHGGQLPAFDSTDKSLDSNFKAAAYQLKDGQYTTTPVKTTAGYEIIQMISRPTKGSFAASKATLTADLYGQWERNTTVMKSVTGTVLRQQHVKIADKTLASSLAAYQNIVPLETATAIHQFQQLTSQRTSQQNFWSLKGHYTIIRVVAFSLA